MRITVIWWPDTPETRAASRSLLSVVRRGDRSALVITSVRRTCDLRRLVRGRGGSSNSLRVQIPSLPGQGRMADDETHYFPEDATTEPKASNLRP